MIIKSLHRYAALNAGAASGRIGSESALLAGNQAMPERILKHAAYLDGDPAAEEFEALFLVRVHDNSEELGVLCLERVDA